MSASLPSSSDLPSTTTGTRRLASSLGTIQSCLISPNQECLKKLLEELGRRKLVATHLFICADVVDRPKSKGGGGKLSVFRVARGQAGRLSSDELFRLTCDLSAKIPDHVFICHSANSEEDKDEDEGIRMILSGEPIKLKDLPVGGKSLCPPFVQSWERDVQIELEEVLEQVLEEGSEPGKGTGGDQVRSAAGAQGGGDDGAGAGGGSNPTSTPTLPPSSTASFKAGCEAAEKSPEVSTQEKETEDESVGAPALPTADSEPTQKPSGKQWKERVPLTGGQKVTGAEHSCEISFDLNHGAGLQGTATAALTLKVDSSQGPYKDNIVSSIRTIASPPDGGSIIQVKSTTYLEGREIGGLDDFLFSSTEDRCAFLHKVKPENDAPHASNDTSSSETCSLNEVYTNTQPKVPTTTPNALMSSTFSLYPHDKLVAGAKFFRQTRNRALETSFKERTRVSDNVPQSYLRKVMKTGLGCTANVAFEVHQSQGAVAVISTAAAEIKVLDALSPHSISVKNTLPLPAPPPEPEGSIVSVCPPPIGRSLLSEYAPRPLPHPMPHY